MNVPRSSGQAAQAARDQSTEVFHLAMYVGAALLFAGALVNAVGISNHVALNASKLEGAAAAS
jgi:hypothetical protein